VRGTRFLIALASVACLIVLGWKVLKPSPPLRILIVADEPQAEDFPRRDLVPLLIFTTDLLESGLGAAVTTVREIPSPEAYRQFPKSGFILRLRARREGDRLGLGGSWIRVEGYARGTGWTPLEVPPALPRAALEALLDRLPLPKAEGPSVLPGDPEAFWALHKAQDLSRSRADREQALEAARASLHREPGSPAALRLLAHLLFQRAAAREATASEDLVAGGAHLEACLKAHPAYPRAASEWLGYKADIGDSRGALARFESFHRARPNVLPHFTGLGYAARYAGHMKAVEKASARLEELHLVPGLPARLQIGLLYLGRQEEYAASLRDYPGDLRNSLVLFLRGHLACLQGRRSEALFQFRDAEQESMGFPHFVKMAGIFRRILEGDLKGARSVLEAMELERQGLLTPDGEVTLHLAEAYCLLGDPDHGLALMERAFSHGFGCTPWFEKNPLLESARRRPRWRALQRHLQERQALIESQFPLDRLGF
jgi:tetratricopeptide (TPR) repeat protein